MQNKIDDLINVYSLTEENFQEYYKTALLVVTAGKRPSENKKLVIVGGQSGAGKSRLVPLAKKELNNNAVIVDFDELRALHPHYKEVSENYTEITHRILHSDTEKVKNSLLDTLIEQGYNVIYEGSLRNTEGFLDFARNFRNNNYNIEMNIMSVPKLESYGSTFIRYATDLLTGKTARWVEKYAHDGSYEGVIKTVEAFKKEKLVDNISVFIRNDDTPKKIYSTNEHQYNNAIDAIKYGREIGRKKAITDFPAKYKSVKTIIENKKPELLSKLDDWTKLYDEEVKYFELLSKENDYDEHGD